MRLRWHRAYALVRGKVIASELPAVLRLPDGDCDEPGLGELRAHFPAAGEDRAKLPRFACRRSC